MQTEFDEHAEEETVGRKRKKHGGSACGRKQLEFRDFDEAYKKLRRQYFDDGGLQYSEHFFRRRFRMSRRLFDRITSKISEREMWFQYWPNPVTKKGTYPLQKFVAALRMLAYGKGGDECDELLDIAGTPFLNLKMI